MARSAGRAIAGYLLVGEILELKVRKILIADRAWMVRDSLARLLTEIASDCSVVMATNGLAFHKALRAHPDLSAVYVEDSLVAEEEEALFSHIRKLAPDAIIAVIVTAPDRERALKAIFYGALGVICVDETREEVLVALALLMGGEVAMPRAVQVADERLDRSGDKPRVPVEVSVKETSRRLTVREREVVELIGQGKAVARIAEELTLSPHTVRVHIARIMKKLDLRDRSALMHHAVTRRYAELPIDG